MSKSKPRKLVADNGLTYHWLVESKQIKVWSPSRKLHVFNKGADDAVGPSDIIALIKSADISL